MSPTDRLLRRGLWGLRSAAPSDRVWARIEAELAPPAGQASRPFWRLTVPMATLAAAVCLAVLGLGGLTVGLGEPRSANRYDVTPLPVAGQGPARVEPAGQPAVAPAPPSGPVSPVHLAVEPPPARLPGWHRPQLALNRAPWPVAAGRLGSDLSEATAEARLE
jgi:hypothetical protein